MCSWLDISIMSIPPFRYSAIPPFRYSAIPLFLPAPLFSGVAKGEVGGGGLGTRLQLLLVYIALNGDGSGIFNVLALLCSL